MDTKDFIVGRAEITERLQGRRSRELSSYPLHMLDNYGVKLPAWAKLALSFVTRGGALSHLLEVGLPLAVPFIFKKQMPFFDRLVHRIFSLKS
jgi:hypothetical protein